MYCNAATTKGDENIVKKIFLSVPTFRSTNVVLQ